MIERATTDPATETLAVNLYRTLGAITRTMRRFDTNRVRSGDLTVAQLSILVALADGPLRIAQLAEHEGVRCPSITVAIRRLEALGLVQRSPHPTDHRGILLTITPEGAGVQRASLAERHATAAAMLSRLSESDRDTLIQALLPLQRLADQSSILMPSRQRARRCATTGTTRRRVLVAESVCPHLQNVSKRLPGGPAVPTAPESWGQRPSARIARVVTSAMPPTASTVLSSR